LLLGLGLLYCRSLYTGCTRGRVRAKDRIQDENCGQRHSNHSDARGSPGDITILRLGNEALSDYFRCVLGLSSRFL
jgi:hypothetical protein